MAAQGYPMDLAVALGAGGFLAGLTRRRESAPLSAFAFAVGCGTVLNPGTVIGKNTNIYPLSSVRGVIEPDSIYKSSGETVKKRHEC